MKGIWMRRFAQLIVGVSSISVVLLFFQNCGQPGGIATVVQDGYDYNDNGELVVKQQSEKTLSASDAPPLKLVFVMDNSNSMTLNNLNLQQSISAMFDSQANNLSQFNAEMYFLTTAQLPSLAGSFTGKIKSPSSMTGSSTQIDSNYRSPFTGLISGDLLGFDIQTTTTTNTVLKEYKAQPVVKFEDGGQGPVVVPSIKYTKGSSIDALKAEVAARLNILSPAKASEITDASVFPALDTESGMCALGRILYFPDNYIRPGDVTSFIVVSDENESDVAGSRCLASQKREYLYNVACVQRIPATVKKETKIKYQTKPGMSTKQTVFTVTPPDLTKNKVITTITLNRSAKNASCGGTQEREFTVNYQVVNKSYVIKYSKQPKVGEREGGIPIYGTLQTGLVTPNQSGMVPADCATNVARLQTILGDTTSKLTITACSQNADVNVSQSPVNLTFASYPNTVFSPNTCTNEVIAALNSGGKLTIVNCTVSHKSEAISASVIAGKGFGANGSLADCQAAVASVCTSSSNTLRSCAQTSYSAAVTADSRGPVSVTQNSALNCNSTCATFPGLCTADNSTPISSFASSNGYSCSAKTAASTETYTVAQSSRSVTIPGSFTCSNMCSEVPGACSGVSSSQQVSQYNKACASVIQDVPGTLPQDKVLAQVLDQDMLITCDTPCANSNGACMGALTVGQHIETNLMGQNCSVERISTNIPEQILHKDLTRVHQSELNTVTCDAGYTKEGSTLSSDFEDSSQNISGSQSLTDYILNRMKAVVGAQAATLSAFITPKGADNGASSTSYGQAYEQLVNLWGKGSVNDIRSPSYAPALTELSQVLRSQLLRSITFPDVQPKQRIRTVWKRAKNASDWGSPLAADQWSATGGTVTLASTVVLDIDDQIKIEFY